MRPVVMQRPQVERERSRETHDLPVLAAMERPLSITPWESLLEDGVQPSLVLGAERRSVGVR